MCVLFDSTRSRLKFWDFSLDTPHLPSASTRLKLKRMRRPGFVMLCLLSVGIPFRKGEIHDEGDESQSESDSGAEGKEDWDVEEGAEGIDDGGGADIDARIAQRAAQAFNRAAAANADAILSSAAVASPPPSLTVDADSHLSPPLDQTPPDPSTPTTNQTNMSGKQYGDPVSRCLSYAGFEAPAAQEEAAETQREGKECAHCAYPEEPGCMWNQDSWFRRISPSNRCTSPCSFLSILLAATLRNLDDPHSIGPLCFDGPRARPVQERGENLRELRDSNDENAVLSINSVASTN
ncbi:hypothetical protein MSAN_00446100 [Mycena sanguinolenta]|uniref:Uncharacterized protein n=1 Tax=Mycena sanguinolenta TaxID=230812 RepID=A0A8H6ZAY3_9AGAR|nr:hypothetical protein MSAN_00446100 [Mycena sanguinolenta]